MKKLIVVILSLVITSCYDYEVIPSEKKSVVIKKQVPDSVAIEADTVRRRCGV